MDSTSNPSSVPDRQSTPRPPSPKEGSDAGTGVSKQDDQQRQGDVDSDTGGVSLPKYRPTQTSDNPFEKQSTVRQGSTGTFAGVDGTQVAASDANDNPPAHEATTTFQSAHGDGELSSSGGGGHDDDDGVWTSG